jgi:hypothetical protein
MSSRGSQVYVPFPGIVENIKVESERIIPSINREKIKLF